MEWHPDSGTFEFFSEAIIGKAKWLRRDFTSVDDGDEVMAKVAADVNGLEYLRLSYYLEDHNKIRAVAINNGHGAVLPSLEIVLNGSYAALSRPLLLYVSDSSLARPAVKEFVEFYAKNAPPFVRAAKHLPLAVSTYAAALQRLSNK